MGKAWIAWLVVGIVVLLLGGGVVWLAIAQNAAQTAQLGLDLGSWIGAWQMRAPMPVLELMAVTGGAVALLVGLPLVAWVLVLRRRVGSLRRQLLLHEEL